jgi:integrase
MQKHKPTVTLYFDNRNDKKKNIFPVKITIYFQGQKKRYNTNISITNDEWAKMSSDKLRDDQLKISKRKLAAIVERAESVLRGLDSFSFEAFEENFFQQNELKKNLDLEFHFNNYINQLNSEGRVGNATSNKTTMNSLLTFKPHLKLSEITPAFLKAYEKFMRDRNASPSTIGIYLRTLRHIIKRAIKDKLLKVENYPFENYVIPTSRNIKKALSAEELRLVLDYQPIFPEQEKALDFWILTYLCNGINMKDLLLLKNGNIDTDFFFFNRSKTILTKKKDLRPIKVYMPERAKSIIKKWQIQGTKEDYLFPILKAGLDPRQIKDRVSSFLKVVNNNMRKIGDELGIDKPMTTYTARHTHATVLKRKGVPTAAIAENLGHSSLVTTEHYLDSFTDDVKREYANLLLD